MSTALKRVVVRKLDRERVVGRTGVSFVADSKVELLNGAGKLVQVPLAEVKAVYFVRDLAGSEEPIRKAFSARPRGEGVWVRLVFKDQEVLEGLMGNDLHHFSSEGFLLTPPDSRGNTQRIFVPRGALQSFTVLGVVKPALARRPGRRTAAEVQAALFREPDPDAPVPDAEPHVE